MAVIRIHLDKRNRKTSNNEFYPLKIRVISNGDKRYIGIESKRINQLLTGNLEKFLYTEGIHYSMRDDFFTRVMESEKGQLKQIKNILLEIERTYQNEADKLNPFTFDAFAKIFKNKRVGRTNDVFTQFDIKIEKLKSENKFNTATSFKSTSESLKLFTGKNKLPFENVTPAFLTKYRSWMQSEGKSETTTGIYLRTLRILVNDAIGEFVNHENYPFHNKLNPKGFKIPEPKGRKLALTTDELKTIFNCINPDDDPGRFYVDSWKLLYLLQGINPKDLCLLKYDNIKNDSLIFKRAKTKDSADIEIEIHLTEKIMNFIKMWGKPYEPDNFIWPVITSDNPEKQTKQIAQFVKMVNKYIERLALKKEIYKDITCYTARHSYATQLMRHGAPVAFISKSLGHTSTKTTDAYLSSFEKEAQKEWQKKVEF